MTFSRFAMAHLAMGFFRPSCLALITHGAQVHRGNGGIVQLELRVGFAIAPNPGVHRQVNLSLALSAPLVGGVVEVDATP